MTSLNKLTDSDMAHRVWNRFMRTNIPRALSVKVGTGALAYTTPLSFGGMLMIAAGGAIWPEIGPYIMKEAEGFLLNEPLYPNEDGVIDGDIYPIDSMRDVWNDAESAQETPPVHYDPLVLDLNRDGKINLDNATFFDLNASGFHEYTRWISETDAFLVLDVNGNGKITATKGSFSLAA